MSAEVVKELITKVSLDPSKAIRDFNRFVRDISLDSEKVAMKMTYYAEKAAMNMVKAWDKGSDKLKDVNRESIRNTVQATDAIARAHSKNAHLSSRSWEIAYHRMDKASKNARSAMGSTSRMHMGSGGGISSAGSTGAASGRGGMGAMMLGGPMRLLGSLGAGYGAYKFAENMFSAAGNKQMIMARLKTVLGSEAAAKSKYDMMSIFAEETPYEKNDLAGGFAAIAGSGYQMTKEDLTALGNVSAGSGYKSFAPMIEMLKSANRGLGSMVDNFDGMRATAEGGVLTMQRYDKNQKKWIKKSVEAGDMAGIVKFVREHGEANYGGQMDAMSKTIPGLASTLKDKTAQRFEDIGDAGMTKVMTDMMNTLVKFTDQSKPFFVSFGKFSAETLPKIVDGFKTVKDYAAPIAGVFGAIAAQVIGMKAFAFFAPTATGGKALAMLGGFFLKAKKLAVIGTLMTSLSGFSGIMPMLAAGGSALLGVLTPLLTGGAIIAGVAALAYLGYQVYQYFKYGEEGIQGLRDKFPMLADGIISISEGFMAWWPVIKSTGIFIGKVLWGALKIVGGVAWWLTREVLIPGLGVVFNFIGALAKGFKNIADTVLPPLANAFVWMKDSAVNFFNYLREQFPWLDKIVRAISGGISGMFGSGEQTAETETVDSGRSLYKGAGGDFFKKNDALAAAMVRSGRGIISGAKLCLRGVWMTHKAAAGVSKITAGKAYQAADQLAADKSFREITVTPEMYQRAMNGDKEMQKLLHGITVIYNRKSTFSPTAGHAEIWDMTRKSALYGLGPKALSRSNTQLQNARYFVPVSSSGGGNNTIQQTIVVNPGSNTGAVKQAAKQGAAEGLNAANRNNQQRTSRR